MNYRITTHSYTVEKFARVKIARYLDICHKTRRETRLYVCRSTDAMTGHVLENTVIFKTVNHISAEHIS